MEMGAIDTLCFVCAIKHTHTHTHRAEPWLVSSGEACGVLSTCHRMEHTYVHTYVDQAVVFAAAIMVYSVWPRAVILFVKNGTDGWTMLECPQI